MITNNSTTDIELIEQWDGLFVGSLTDEEYEIFTRAVKEGIAFRSYEGVGGFMGLAKVRSRHFLL